MNHSTNGLFHRHIPWHAVVRMACMLLPLLFVLPATAEPLLKNSGFDAKLTPWECDEGKIVADPQNKDNTLLEVTLDGGVFGLGQPFHWPKGKDSLILTFRVKASAATKNSPVQWRLRLYDPGGNSGLAASGKIDTSGSWITVKKTIRRPEGDLISILLESNRGEGKLWMDDVTLE